MTQHLECLPLPKTAGCLVCGPTNPHGLHLRFFVDAAGRIDADFTPEPHHIGFEGILHGGVLATVLDEAMVWSAIWHTRRACLAAEINVRFRVPALVGQTLAVRAEVVSARGKLIQTEGRLELAGQVVAEATGKFIARSDADSAGLMNSFVVDRESRVAREHLTHG
jgi:uncharacterized protein (TIGR00369 family)